MDETPVKLLRPDKQGYLWTYFAPHVGAGLVVFEASSTRSGEVAKKRLQDFEGVLQTDGYNGYKSLRTRQGIVPYLRHGWAEIDTNWVENQIRPIAVGKKNVLFMGHEQSASIHALFYSLVLSSILNKINPRLYLNYLLSQIHAIRQKIIKPSSLLPHTINNDSLSQFAQQQLQCAISVLNSIA